LEQSIAPSKGSVLSAMFLVGGTCIGGGMLALPVATGVSGFIPSLVVMAICWIAMTATALLLLEVSLWLKEGAHIITMTSTLLGPIGKAVSWCLYLFICYASIVAYTAGGGIQLERALFNYAGIEISRDLSAFLFITVLSAVIYLGSRIVGRVNAILFVAMVVAYAGLVGMGIGEVKPELLTNQNWSMSLLAIPLLLTSFSFQTMVPSLTPYLKKHANALRVAIIGGTSLAFIVYLIWQWLILGIVPIQGPNGLADALSKGEPATLFLQEHVGGSWIVPVAEYFAFFAIVTSFLGLTLGLFDFLSDGLKIKKEGFGRIVLGMLIVIPTWIFATKFERVFLVALDTSGGFGDSILNGIIPVLMVWIGRYRLGYPRFNFLPGGKPVLVVVFAFFLFALLLEILVHAGVISSIYESYDIFEKNVEQFEIN
jgi:tyrosine-specific transport protein